MASVNRDEEQRWVPTHVQVLVIRARGLRAKGKHGTSDAYTVVQLGKEKYSTCVMEKSTEPEWGEECSFELQPGVLDIAGRDGHPASTCDLTLTVMHRALIGLDVFLGQTVISLDKAFHERVCMRNEWYKLHSKTGKKEKERGELQLTVQFTRHNLTASMYDLSMKDKPRSAFIRLRERMRARKRCADEESSSAIVPGGYGALARMRGRLPSDGGGEEDYEDDEGGELRRSKMRSYFLHGRLRKSSDTRSSTSLGSESSESSSRGGSLSPTAGISVVVSDLSNSPSNSSNLTADNSPEHTIAPSPLVSPVRHVFDEVCDYSIPVPHSLSADSDAPFSLPSVCVNGNPVETSPLTHQPPSLVLQQPRLQTESGQELPRKFQTSPPEKGKPTQAQTSQPSEIKSQTSPELHRKQPVVESKCKPDLQFSAVGLLQKGSALSLSLQNLSRRKEEQQGGGPIEGRRWSFDKPGKEEKAAIAAALENAGLMADETVVKTAVSVNEVEIPGKKKRGLFSHSQAEKRETGQAQLATEGRHRGWFSSKDPYSKPSVTALKENVTKVKDATDNGECKDLERNEVSFVGKDFDINNIKDVLDSPIDLCNISFTKQIVSDGVDASTGNRQTSSLAVSQKYVFAHSLYESVDSEQYLTCICQDNSSNVSELSPLANLESNAFQKSQAKMYSSEENFPTNGNSQKSLSVLQRDFANLRQNALPKSQNTLEKPDITELVTMDKQIHDPPMDTMMDNALICKRIPDVFDLMTSTGKDLKLDPHMFNNNVICSTKLPQSQCDGVLENLKNFPDFCQPTENMYLSDFSSDPTSSITQDLVTTDLLLENVFVAQHAVTHSVGTSPVTRPVPGETCTNMELCHKSIELQISKNKLIKFDAATVTQGESLDSALLVNNVQAPLSEPLTLDQVNSGHDLLINSAFPLIDLSPLASSTPHIAVGINSLPLFAFPIPSASAKALLHTTVATAVLSPVFTASNNGFSQEEHQVVCHLSSPHPVKPLTPPDEKRSEGRSVLEKLKSTIHPGRSHQGDQEHEKKLLVEGGGSYYHLNHGELVSLLLQRDAELQQEREDYERRGLLLDKREVEIKKMKVLIRDLEDYIDTLLVRIMEQTPALLQAIFQPDTGEKIPMPFRMSGEGVSVSLTCVSVCLLAVCSSLPAQETWQNGRRAVWTERLGKVTLSWILIKAFGSCCLELLLCLSEIGVF
ncbi:Rab11 family-interacting protein 5 [Bagarius yarrelli]|uniref:Rab11 family-interacting protein 5 n=1 Tax=Bagarius yarrelli TaxID=175774 RepID=A0A556V683_BAGYA|nr:Rab11 family-interacting protein 5 [Bagarius yarrelli]